MQRHSWLLSAWVFSNSLHVTTSSPLNKWLPSWCHQNVLNCVFEVVVEEMNRLGMIVDLSHTSWNTSFAVLSHSKAPVIFSHSSSYSICNHSRNVPDSLLLELVRNTTLKAIACLLNRLIKQLSDQSHRWLAHFNCVSLCVYLKKKNCQTIFVMVRLFVYQQHKTFMNRFPPLEIIQFSPTKSYWFQS